MSSLIIKVPVVFTIPASSFRLNAGVWAEDLQKLIVLAPPPHEEKKPLHSLHKYHTTFLKDGRACLEVAVGNSTKRIGRVWTQKYNHQGKYAGLAGRMRYLLADDESAESKVPPWFDPIEYIGQELKGWLCGDHHGLWFEFVSKLHMLQKRPTDAHKLAARRDLAAIRRVRELGLFGER